MLSLGICLAYVLWAQAQGQTAGQFVPVTMWVTAGIYALAATLTFVFLKEHAQPQLNRARAASQWQQLRQTFQEAKAYKDFMQLMACAVAYQGGVAVAITLAAIYAEQVIGFQPQETMVLIFVLNIAAFVGALVFTVLRDQLAILNPIYWYFWIGLLLVLIVTFFPSGILPGSQSWWKRWRARRGSGA
jgi:UMF1 family MFS transporter